MNYKTIMLIICTLPIFFMASDNNLIEQIQQLEKEIIKAQAEYYALEKQIEQIACEDSVSKEAEEVIILFAHRAFKIKKMQNRLTKLKEEAYPENSLAAQIKKLEEMIVKEEKRYQELEQQMEQMTLENPFSKETDRIVDVFSRQLMKLEGMQNKLNRLKREAGQS